MQVSLRSQVSIFVIFASFAANADESSKLVSEQPLISIGCSFTADTDEYRNKQKPVTPPLKLVCPDQSTIAGYNHQVAVLTQYAKEAYKAATTRDRELSTAEALSFVRSTQLVLLEKAHAAEVVTREICMKRFRLIDELIAKGEISEVLSYYHSQIPIYESFYKDRVGCTVMSNRIDCPIPTDKNLLLSALMEIGFYQRYTDFVAKNDASLGEEVRKSLGEFVISLDELLKKFRTAAFGPDRSGRR